SLTGGRRDFSSVSLTVPSKYEVLVEHKHAQRAREILGAGGLGSIPGYAEQQLTTPAPAAEQTAPPAGSI
ncbi:MAG: hypothetical protein M3Y06_02770, partial [Actinomycetota bacterium]|nr:hypothetical protein [Actinomycetota bacterium]